MKIVKKQKSLRKKTMRKGGKPTKSTKKIDSLVLMEEGMSPIKVIEISNFFREITYL